ncbi:hypothetical protein O181_058362 [Austropuccinia psidii MF-1]|uniref:Uncharacterized protein n=1 Tax=Austropuccinia psidii MF-1 TaxID=1389203 RepID=A0A9Q3EEH9_9BASI|nr:hypothetical protein [Austropuccinia psidii MF-1]
MSSSTRAKKAANNKAELKPLSNDDMYSMLTSLKNEVMTLKSAISSEDAKIKWLQMGPSSPWAPMPPHTTSPYDLLMQEPYHSTNCFAPLKSNGSNFAEWLACLDWVISVAINTEILVVDSPSSLDNQSPEENRAICHFINVSIPHEFALCVGITPSQLTAKAFFITIKACCSCRNRFEKLRLIRSMLTMLVKNRSGTPQPNDVIILFLTRTFVLLKKLGIKADELEVTTAILAKGDEKPTLTFVVQIILNASTKANKENHQLSPFLYRVAERPATPTYPQRPRSPGPTQPWCQASTLSPRQQIRCHLLSLWTGRSLAFQQPSHQGACESTPVSTQAKNTGGKTILSFGLPVPT